MNMVFLLQGHCHLGVSHTDKDGNVTAHEPARFEADENGPCIAVGTMDADTMKQTGEFSIYGDYDVAGYLQRVEELLVPTRNRPSNMPNIEHIVKAMTRAQVDICDYCKAEACWNCILREWKDESEE
jgi:hypothetical protein